MTTIRLTTAVCVGAAARVSAASLLFRRTQTENGQAKVGKRTNDFQTVITLICGLLAERGTVVEESDTTPDSGGLVRERDITIRTDGGPPIAIECRDRSRRETVEWIDQLHGKYSGDDQRLVVAVSKSGFTPAAIKLAARHGIETLSLDQAKIHDWHSLLGQSDASKNVSVAMAYRSEERRVGK